MAVHFHEEDLPAGVLAEGTPVAVDTETSDLDAMQADLVGFSLALGPNDACYVPLAHGSDDMFDAKPQQVDRDAALAAIKRFQRPTTTLTLRRRCRRLSVFWTPVVLAPWAALQLSRRSWKRSRVTRNASLFVFPAAVPTA